jgi:hypothetical protein
VHDGNSPPPDWAYRRRMPDSCNKCGEPLHVEGDVAVCLNGHRWEYEGEVQTIDGPSLLVGRRLPDEED